MMPEKNKEIDSLAWLSQSEIYDLYAPAVYGKILSIVHKGPIADKILEKIFVEAFTINHILYKTPRRPLISLLNHSREKSYKVIKALNIFNECCAGTTICINNKK